jgi:RHS repeat-associated protein
MDYATINACPSAGMYVHQRSGLNLTLVRAYSPSLGRWLSRDPLGESAGTNLYGYVGMPMLFNNILAHRFLSRPFRRAHTRETEGACLLLVYCH